MKVGVITSHIEHLYLFRFLQTYDFSYTIYYDQEGADWYDTPCDLSEKRVQFFLDRALADGMDYVILPPLRELRMRNKEKNRANILPLFTTYVMEHCLPYSLVGKIGCIGERADLQERDMYSVFMHTRERTPAQQRTLSFHIPFAHRMKHVSLWKHFLVSLGWKNRMMHQIVKHDIRYFLDAGVDTLIPLHYGYCAYDTTIKKFLGTKKIRRHGLDAIHKTYDSLVSEQKDINEKSSPLSHNQSYAVRIVYTGTLDHLLAEKKRVWLLQRGKEILIQREHIYFHQ